MTEHSAGRAMLTGAAVLLAVSGCVGGPTRAAPELPPRPVSLLRIDGVDPCALLTVDQLRGLGMAGPGHASKDVDGSPVCQWRPAYVLSSEGQLVRLVTDHEAAYYLDNQRPVQIVNVAGYGAVETNSPLESDVEDNCMVIVDVAPGQALFTAYGADRRARTSRTTHEQSCARARQGAEAMVSTLQALRGQGR